MQKQTKKIEKKKTGKTIMTDFMFLTADSGNRLET